MFQGPIGSGREPSSSTWTPIQPILKHSHFSRALCFSFYCSWPGCEWLYSAWTKLQNSGTGNGEAWAAFIWRLTLAAKWLHSVIGCQSNLVFCDCRLSSRYCPFFNSNTTLPLPQLRFTIHSSPHARSDIHTTSHYIGVFLLYQGRFWAVCCPLTWQVVAWTGNIHGVIIWETWQGLWICIESRTWLLLGIERHMSPFQMNPYLPY